MSTSKWVSRKIMSEILDAIHAPDRSTHVFYITSKGGDGKTVLLRQIGMEMGSADGIAPSFPWSGILDLYHSEVNSSSGLETRLSQVLDTTGQFLRFRTERDAWAARREAGLLGPELEFERIRMAEVFAECLNSVTLWGRVVIALDTTERIQYEVDEIQKLCRMEDESTTVRTWLLDQLCRWENCVVLLVGRPEADPYLSSALQETLARYPGVHYKARELGGFDQEEVCRYFEKKETEFPALSQIGSDLCHRLWEVTEGSPIKLDLAVEVIQHGLEFDRFQRQIETGAAKKVHREIDRLLIDHVMRGEPDSSMRNILRYLAVARKGLDADLLHHLESEWNLETCRARLGEAAKRGFVKQHPDDERLFLHDEMYQLCDRHLVTPEEVQRFSRRIARWYDERIEATGDREQRQDLQMDSLLYRLRADPREGYQWYARQAEFAIRAVEVGFDLRMHNEVIAFLKSPSLVDERLLANTPGLIQDFDCDCAAGWVKRLMVRGENEEAVQVAERVRQAGPALCPQDVPGFELARADLDVYHAQAAIYSAGTDKAVNLLTDVIDRHEAGYRPEELAIKDPESFDGWRRNLILGRAHNNLGYALWMHLGHYQASLKEFRAALPYFRASNLEEELANTNDNMGRVWALLRHPTRAASLVDEGLRLRRQLARDYRIGLSLNSRAIVHLEFGEPHRARQLSTNALSIFELLGTQRGIGLASITLGHALRDLGQLWEDELYSFQECEEFLSDGAKHLERAIVIFRDRVNEPVRLARALNELGCLYRVRAILAEEMAPGRPLARTIFSEAIKYLERSIELAKESALSVLYVDSCEDLARIYFLRRDYKDATRYLDQAEEHVPNIYKLDSDEFKDRIPDEECVEEFWFQLGKIELLRGNLVFDVATEHGSRPAPEEVLEDTARHYLFATTYFARFSERAVGLRRTFEQMFTRFRSCSFEELQHLREILPTLAKQHDIDLTRLGSFFEDTLGLALQP